MMQQRKLGRPLLHTVKGASLTQKEQRVMQRRATNRLSAQRVRDRKQAELRDLELKVRPALC